MVLSSLFLALLPPGPVSPHPSREAKDLLVYLNRLSGQATMTGQHNYPLDGNRDEWMEKAKALTGRYPAVWGSDFGWDKGCKEARPKVVAEAIRQWKAGSLVTLSWHPVRPDDVDGTDAPDSWKKSVQNRLNDEEWAELIKVGSPLNKKWISQIDVVAGHLKALRAARVPVLWRPYHEMNGGWFWWGDRPGKSGYAALWRQMFERYTKVHKLDNLLWVWGPNAPDGKWAKPYADFYPGHNYVDVLAADIYNADFRQAYYDDLLKLGEGRPIAMGEVGALPSPEVLKAQPRWLWFLAWAEHLVNANKPEAILATYHDARVVGRDEVKARGVRGAAGG